MVIILLLVLSNRGQFESAPKSQVVSPTSPPPVQNLQSPLSISNSSQMQPLVNTNQLVNIATSQQQQLQQQAAAQQQQLSSQTIPVSSIILEPPQNNLVHSSISLMGGAEVQPQPQVKINKFQ